MSQVIEQIQNRRIYMHVAMQLERLIADGVYRLGGNLPPERELAQQFGVSRSSVREGIIALEVKGYVAVRVGSGVTVLRAPAKSGTGNARTDGVDGRHRPMVQAEVPPFDMLRARLLIEPECAALAAENGTDAQLRGIAHAYRRNVADNRNRSLLYIGDRLFHIRIAEASDNPVYAVAIRQMLRRYGNLFQHLQRIYTPNEMHDRSEKEHLEILTALQERKPVRARNAMQAHLQAVVATFLREH